MRHVLKRSRNLNELLKVFFVRVGEDRVGTVTFLFFGLLIYLHLVRLTNFFHSKFNSADFQDVLLLNFVILAKIENTSLIRSSCVEV